MAHDTGHALIDEYPQEHDDSRLVKRSQNDHEGHINEYFGVVVRTRHVFKARVRRKRMTVGIGSFHSCERHVGSELQPPSVSEQSGADEKRRGDKVFQLHVDVQPPHFV